MAATPKRGRARRPPLSRERVIEAAVHVADARGVASVTMRNVAERLGVEAMSLYHHVADKDEILDGIVDRVFEQIGLPHDETDWKSAMRERAVSTRAALARHPWALGLLESRRTPGTATVHHLDWVIGCLRAAGFSIGMAAHALSLIDGYVYGFVLQEASLAFTSSATVEDVAATILEQLPIDRYPHFTEMIMDHALQPGYSHADEFRFGLELILDGLDRAAHGAPP